MGSNLKNLIVGAILFLGIAFGVQHMRETKVDSQQIEYSQFIQQVKEGKISNLNIEGSPIGYRNQRRAQRQIQVQNQRAHGRQSGNAAGG